MVDKDSWWKESVNDAKRLELEVLIGEIQVELIGLKYSVENAIFTKQSMSESIGRLINKCNKIK